MPCVRYCIESHDYADSAHALILTAVRALEPMAPTFMDGITVAVPRERVAEVKDLLKFVRFDGFTVRGVNSVVGSIGLNVGVWWQHAPTFALKGTAAEDNSDIECRMRARFLTHGRLILTGFGTPEYAAIKAASTVPAVSVRHIVHKE